MSSFKKVVPLAALICSSGIYAQESSGSPGTQRVVNLQGDYVQSDYDVAQTDYVETKEQVAAI